jgi:hypothetical protein
MNKTVELVNRWGAYEQQHPNCSIDDFCRHYLASQNQKMAKGNLVGGVVPSLSDALLLKIIGRISKLNMAYANIALKGTELNQIEEFGVLQTIKKEKNPKKTEVIYANLFELSSGPDVEDKRSKRIELTVKGKKVADTCRVKIEKNATMLMRDLTEEDKDLCIQLLKNIEIKYSALLQKHKSKDFEDIYSELMAKREA